MQPQDIAFFVFSALTLLCGIMVISRKNPVTSAMFLVLCIISMAGLFVLLHAFFLAAIQVIVYAGAVMVVFLFVIMLLDLKVEQARKFKAITGILAFLSVAAVAGVIISIIWKTNPSAGLAPAEVIGGTSPLGMLLFNKFLLPFEIMSLLLLVAMVGVILLSKKDLQ
ncbi:MAG: NADH-quinone oxidoreductase subunit J [Verrucomicrobiales bacterium]